MSTLLADIDVTCATLGYFDGQKYYEDAGILQNLKHLLWILHNDNSNHDFLRHIAKTNVLQNDLIPLLCTNPEDEVFQALIRLLIVLTNPISILYREGPPKDGANRSVYLELVDYMTKYKEALVADAPWVNLALKLHKSLETDTMVRGEAVEITIERILVLIRNVLRIPTNISNELCTNSGPSTHDQVVWVLLQSGMLDLILYILNSADEHRFHLHALEIVCLVLTEQTASSLASISMQRSTPEKRRNEEELVEIRCAEKEKVKTHPRPMRHPRFGGTYVFQNMKSVSDNDMIYHQPLQQSTTANFDREKMKRKSSHRIVEEGFQNEYRSVYSVRLRLREFCTEILRSAYNTLVRKIRNLLQYDTARKNNDDSYLLWAITFFMEFNRLSGLPFELVSESMSIQCFHWVLTEMTHHMDIMETDKEKERTWAKRLNVAVRAFKEMLLSMIGLQKLKAEKPQSLFQMLLSNICGTLEFRECVLQLLLLYKPTRNTKIYLQDAIETSYYFVKILKASERTMSSSKSQSADKWKKGRMDKLWPVIAPTISNVLESYIEEGLVGIDNEIFDKESDETGGKCVMKIHSLLHEGNYKEAIAIARLAVAVWPENIYFNTDHTTVQDELKLLRRIFASSPKAGRGTDTQMTLYEDYMKRFANPKVIRACVIVLTDWKQIKTSVLKSTVAMLHAIVTTTNYPALLYQASLFRIFQQALDAKRNQHNMELQRLGIYIVRNFVQSAENNPKIFAELLFYKTISECFNLENPDDQTTPKTSWTTEEEDELRHLYERHQLNPQTEQDVIEWLTKNLSDGSKSRYDVMDKLAEMDLKFGKLSRKPKGTTSKNFWTDEEDERLTSLYVEYKSEGEDFSIIEQGFNGRKSRDNIIQRMIFLQLIIDRSDIFPEDETNESSRRDSVHYESEDETPQTAPKPNVIMQLKEEDVVRLLGIVKEKFKDEVEWLKESLVEACDDLYTYGESEDEVPLVPITRNQSAALADEDFKTLLLSIGIQPPSNSERFWRFPCMNSYEFQARIKLIDSGNESNENKFEELRQSESDGTDTEPVFSNSLQKIGEKLANLKTDRIENVDDDNVKPSRAKRLKHFESDESDDDSSLQSKKQKITTSGFDSGESAVEDS